MTGWFVVHGVGEGEHTCSNVIMNVHSGHYCTTFGTSVAVIQNKSIYLALLKVLRLYLYLILLLARPTSTMRAWPIGP